MALKVLKVKHNNLYFSLNSAGSKCIMQQTEYMLWLMIMLVGLGDATLREIRSSGCIAAPSEFNVWETHKHRIRVIRARETSELQAMVCDRFLV